MAGGNNLKSAPEAPQQNEETGKKGILAKVFEALKTKDPGRLDKMEAEMHKGLDQIKDSGDIASAPATIKQMARKGYETGDILGDTNIPDEKKELACQLFDEAWENSINPFLNPIKIREIALSNENNAVSDFISDFENLPKFKELMVDVEGKSGMESLIASIVPAELVPGLMGALSAVGLDKITGKGKGGVIGGIMSFLKGEKPEETEGNSTETATAENETSETQETQNPVLKILADAGIKVDTTNWEAEVKASGVTEEELKTMAQAASDKKTIPGQIVAALKEQMGETEAKNVTYKVADLVALARLDEEKKGAVLNAMETLKKDGAKARTFLDDVQKTSEIGTIALASYNNPEVADNGSSLA